MPLGARYHRQRQPAPRTWGRNNKLCYRWPSRNPGKSSLPRVDRATPARPKRAATPAIPAAQRKGAAIHAIRVRPRAATPARRRAAIRAIRAVPVARRFPRSVWCRVCRRPGPRAPAILAIPVRLRRVVIHATPVPRRREAAILATPAPPKRAAIRATRAPLKRAVIRVIRATPVPAAVALKFHRLKQALPITARSPS